MRPSASTHRRPKPWRAIFESSTPPQECDSTQAAVPSAAGEIDVPGIPVDRLAHFAAREVDEIDAAVALPLAGAAYDGSRDERRWLHSGGLLRLSSASIAFVPHA